MITLVSCAIASDDYVPLIKIRSLTRDSSGLFDATSYL